ncbi:hypothetical protein Nmel_012637, partial [Mimus melanotis]
PKKMAPTVFELIAVNYRMSSQPHTPKGCYSVHRWLWENRKSHCNMKRGSDWQTIEGYESRSPQMVELRAVTMAFQHFPHTPLNVVTDSAYVANITQRLD